MLGSNGPSGTDLAMSAEQYRVYALDCLGLAEASNTSETKSTLLAMAQCWAKLADQAQKNAKTDMVYGPPPYGW
jgi:hypothetical protein